LSFVLDNSVALTWCFEKEKTPMTQILLEQATISGAVAPELWPLEAVNGLLQAQRRGRIHVAQRAELAHFLKGLPITIDCSTHERVWTDALSLAERHRLTIYDAAYLELALRLELPLATLDDDLRKAAKAEKIEVLGK
jgi:predicted nucleic acid-binding protein